MLGAERRAEKELKKQLDFYKLKPEEFNSAVKMEIVWSFFPSTKFYKYEELKKN